MQRLLAGDEKVIWTGRPERLFAEDRPYFMVISLALCFAGMICFAGLVARYSYQLGTRWDLRWAANPMLATGVGAAVILVCLLLTGSGQRNVCYAITNKRVLLWPPAFFGYGVVAIIYPEQITECSIRMRSASMGDLILCKQIVETTEGRETVDRGFFAISDVRRVQSFVRAILPAGTPSSTTPETSGSDDAVVNVAWGVKDQTRSSQK